MAKRPSPRASARPRTAATAKPASSPWRSPWAEAGLVALTLLVYLQVRHFAFVNWDDPAYVFENSTVLGGLSAASIQWAFTNQDSPNWHPLTWLSHLLDVTIFGADAGAHHLVSLAIHVANVLGVFWILRRLTAAPGRSLVVAALFAIHPLHVESVAWIAERKDVLSTLFVLMAFWAYLDYVQRPTWLRYATVAGLFALALMAKPMVVTFPVLLLVVDAWPLQRLDRASARSVVLEKVPLIALAMADSIATVLLQSRVGAMAALGAESAFTRIERTLATYVTYVGQTIWPVHLAAFYPQQPVSVAAAVAAAVILIGVTVVAIRLWDRAPYVAAGWAWFLVAVAPVSGVLQTGEQAHADRYMYLGLLGLLVAIVWGLADACSKWTPQPALSAGIAGIAIACGGVLAFDQVATWSDSLTLWQHAADVTTGNYKAFEKIGEGYRNLGNFDEARANYQHALALAPPDAPRYAAVIHDDLGLVSMRQGRMDDAQTEFTTASTIDPTNGEARINLGNALASKGDLADAAAEFTDALRLLPTSAEAEIGLGNVLLEQDQAADAETHFTNAIRLKPGMADAYNGRGAARLQAGQAEHALADFSDALRLRPAFPNADLNAAVALMSLGRHTEARQHLTAALAVNPNLAQARALLAQIDRQ